MSRYATIGVIGAGAWGTALANAAARGGGAVTLWTRDTAHAAEMRASRQNARRLPGVALEAGVAPVCDLALAGSCDAVLLVTPAQTIAAMARELFSCLKRQAPVVLCAKGIDQGSGRFLDDLVAQALPGHPLAVLSGPSFAADVARGLPTAVSLACPEADVAEELSLALSGITLRVYHGTDVRGVEIGGATKNVLAIACGVVIGAGLGESARAALVARGFAELMRFARAYGGEPRTLMGLSGLGDLVLSCSSPQSRNFSFGLALGQGQSVAEAARGVLVEGAATAPALLALARAKGVEMPIVEQVAGLVAGQTTVAGAISALLGRPMKAEI